MATLTRLRRRRFMCLAAISVNSRPVSIAVTATRQMTASGQVPMTISAQTGIRSCSSANGLNKRRCWGRACTTLSVAQSLPGSSDDTKEVN
jgi:hypothetical protein